MYVYVQVTNYSDRIVRIEVEPQEPVASLKDKLSAELGGDVSAEAFDTLNYVGIILQNERELGSYNIRESSLLYLGRSPYSFLLPSPAASAVGAGPAAASGALSGGSNSNLPNNQPAISAPTPGPYEVVWG